MVRSTVKVLEVRVERTPGSYVNPVVSYTFVILACAIFALFVWITLWCCLSQNSGRPDGKVPYVETRCVSFDPGRLKYLALRSLESLLDSIFSIVLSICKNFCFSPFLISHLIGCSWSAFHLSLLFSFLS